ncbi:MAG: phosphatase PAP2 family protein [Chlamydiales bacterium]
MKIQWKWISPFIFISILAPFTPWLDLALARFFFKEGAFYNSPFFRFMFCYGERFGFLVAFIALAVFLLSFFAERFRKMRRGALAMVVTLILGAGLVVNVGLKEFWGRPRPKQVIEFGGTQHYRPFWSPNFGKVEGDAQKSFPSGHTAIGFYYLSLLLVGRRYRNRALYYSGLGLTSFWGIGLMLTRVVQGGHFFSDVIVSPAIMWWSALFVDHLLFTRQNPPALGDAQESPCRRS